MKYGFILVMGLVMIFGCGGGNDSWLPKAPPDEVPPTQGTVPFISKLEYQPTSAARGEGGGAVAVRGTFDFFDQDGDLNTTGKCAVPCGGGEETCEHEPVFVSPGVQGGTLNFSLQMSTTCAPGNYVTTLMVRDAQDQESNKLTVLFSITP
jgi:hypothetical protein